MQKSSKVGIEIVPFTAMRRYLPAARPWRSGCGTEGSCRCQDSDCPDSCRHKSGPAWFDTRARTAAGPGGRIDARAARRSRFAGHLKRLGAAHCPPADIGRRRPPNLGPAAMPKRAAIYLRVSTDRQTLENQRQALQGVAERRGWEVVAVYSDAGISGIGSGAR